MSLELEHAIGYSGTVHGNVHIHPNGRDFIYSAGGCVVLADLGDPHNQVFLRGHDDAITTLDISSTGMYIASAQGGENADIVVWDADTKQLVHRFSEHDDGVLSVSFSDDEKLLCSCGVASDRKLIVWDLETGGIVAVTHLGYTMDVLAFGGHEKDVKRRYTPNYVLASAHGNVLSVWILNPYKGELTEQKVNLGPLVREFRSLSFSRDGEWLYAGTTSGECAIIYMKSLQLVHYMFVSSNGVHSIQPLEYGFCVGGGDGSVTLFTGFGKEAVQESKTYLEGAVTSLSVTTDEVEILCGTESGFLYRARTRDLMELLIVESHQSSVLGIAGHKSVPDRFISVSSDTTVRVWDLNDYAVIAKSMIPHHSKGLCVVCLSEYILVGCDNGKVCCFDNDRCTFLWEIDAHRFPVTAICASHNEKFFLTGGEDGDIRVWLFKTRELVCSLKEHHSAIHRIVIFEDDMHALSCSRDRHILCWNLRDERRTSTMIQKLGAVYSADVFADQSVAISVGQDRRLSFWDLREAEIVKSVENAHQADIRCVVISPSDEYIATGGADQVVRFWSSKGRLLSEGFGHSSTVTSLYFTEDERQLITGGANGAMLVFNVYPEEENGR